MFHWEVKEIGVPVHEQNQQVHSLSSRDCKKSKPILASSSVKQFLNLCTWKEANSSACRLVVYRFRRSWASNDTQRAWFKAGSGSFVRDIFATGRFLAEQVTEGRVNAWTAALTYAWAREPFDFHPCQGNTRPLVVERSIDRADAILIEILCMPFRKSELSFLLPVEKSFYVLNVRRGPF